MTDPADTIRSTLTWAPLEYAGNANLALDALLAERQQAQQRLENQTKVVEALSVDAQRWFAERQQAQEKLWEQSEAAASLIKEIDRLEIERQQAIDALRQAQHHCRENIRRAAFAPEIGTRYTEKLRLAIADECRRLEDGIAAALVKLGEKP